jgi:short-subunit dehydrogenase
LDEKPVGVVTAVGYFGNQDSAQSEFLEARKIIDTNYTGIVSFLNVVADDFETRGSGFIVGITSVAGDRGRKANYIYASSKAALSTYLSGLRNRLSRANVQVLTVKLNAQKRNRNVIYVHWTWRWIMLVIRNIPEVIFKKTSL